MENFKIQKVSQIFDYDLMQKCSAGFILDLKCGAGKKGVFMKIDIDDLPIGQV